MRIFVTGGLGFLGAHFIRRILRKYRDWRVTNIDKLTYAGNPKNLADAEKDPGYKFIKGDITNAALVDRLFAQGLDVIVNFAAETNVDRSIMDPAPFVATNVRGTQVLLDAALRYGVKKFIQVSSSKAYGSLGDDEQAFTEKSPLLPINPYAASKASADLLGVAYYQKYGLPVVIVRCANLFGPFQHPEKFIPFIVTNVILGRPVCISDSGLSVREWLFVEDCCRALELAVFHGRPGEVYNVGSGQELSRVELAEIILAELGKPEVVVDFTGSRPGHERRNAINSEKIGRELGWKAEYNFRDALCLTVDWYLGNQEWWEEIVFGSEYRKYYQWWYRKALKGASG